MGIKSVLGKFRVLVIHLMLGLACNSVQAQQFNEKQVQLIEGKTYYLHKVEQGNTLYSLSKMYSIKIKDLLDENPQLEEGLKIGQVIRIPVKKVDKKISGGNAPTIEGNFLIHEVLPKETLYSLSKRYGVSVNDIQQLNPQLKDGLKIGMELKIPPPKELQKGVDSAALQPAQEDSFLLHFVEPQQTLYSLAIEYNVNIDSIRLINGGLKDGLKVGTTIRIPIAKQGNNDLESQLVEDTSTEETQILDSTELKSKYIVSLLIPFYLDSNDSIVKSRLDFEQEEIYKPSTIGLEFYSGFKFGVEQLMLDSVEVEIRVEDISLDPKTRNTSPVQQLIHSERFFESDLIVGPFHRSNLELAAKYAKNARKPLVCPVPQRTGILKDNPYLFKVFSSDATQVDFIRFYAEKNWKGKNVVLVENNELKDVILCERFRGINASDTNWAIYNGVNSWVDRLKVYDFDTAKFNRILNDTAENILIVPANSRSFIGRFLAGMHKYSSKYNLKVVGLESWNKMGYLEYRYLNDLNVHVTQNQYFNYEDSIRQEFVLQYRNTYHTEPGEWELLGYDLAVYFISSLAKYGTAFQNYCSVNPYRGMAKDFEFKRFAPNSGFENRALKMVKIENYQYIELPK